MINMAYFAISNSIPMSWLYNLIVCIWVSNSNSLFHNLIVIMINIKCVLFTSAFADGFHRCLVDSKSPQASKNLLRILADLNNVEVCMVSVCPSISNSFKHLLIVPNIVTFYSFLFIRLFIYFWYQIFWPGLCGLFASRNPRLFYVYISPELILICAHAILIWLNFSCLPNSQWITFTTQSCLLIYFCALIIIIIIIIIIIVVVVVVIVVVVNLLPFISSKFFNSVVTVDFHWILSDKHLSSVLQDSFKYSGWSQQCYILESWFILWFSVHTNYNCYH